MTVLSKNPTSNSVVVTGWTNPTYIYNEDGTQLGTAAPAKNAYITSDFGGFDFSSVPDTATINSLTVGIYVKGSTQTTALIVLWQPWSGGAAIGSENSQTSIPVNLTWYDVTWTMTVAQLKASNFLVRLRANRTGNTAYTASVDYIRVTVDYSTSQTYNEAPSLAKQSEAIVATALTNFKNSVALGHSLGVTPRNQIGVTHSVALSPSLGVTTQGGLALPGTLNTSRSIGITQKEQLIVPGNLPLSLNRQIVVGSQAQGNNPLSTSRQAEISLSSLIVAGNAHLEQRVMDVSAIGSLTIEETLYDLE